MKATIREHVPGNRLRDTVPPLYRDAVMKDTDQSALYTVILLAHNPRDVVHSAPLARAFRRLGETGNEAIIIVGTVFTEEAKELAHERSARIVALHKATWTDESARQRQL